MDLRDVNSDDEMVRDGEGAIRGNSNIGLIIIAFILHSKYQLVKEYRSILLYLLPSFLILE